MSADLRLSSIIKTFRDVPQVHSAFQEHCKTCTRECKGELIFKAAKDWGLAGFGSSYVQVISALESVCKRKLVSLRVQDLIKHVRALHVYCDVCVTWCVCVYVRMCETLTHTHTELTSHAGKASLF